LRAISRAELPTGTVTFLFTDVEGSTPLLSELGDAYADALAKHRSFSYVRPALPERFFTSPALSVCDLVEPLGAAATPLAIRPTHASRRRSGTFVTNSRSEHSQQNK